MCSGVILRTTFKCLEHFCKYSSPLSSQVFISLISAEEAAAFSLNLSLSVFCGFAMIWFVPAIRGSVSGSSVNDCRSWAWAVRCCAASLRLLSLKAASPRECASRDASPGVFVTNPGTLWGLVDWAAFATDPARLCAKDCPV